MAKSNRRKRQDRVKAAAKRAEQARHRAKAERDQQTAERYRCLLDPLTSPADVAGILAAELPDSLAAGAMMQIRLSSGVPGGEIAQTDGSAHLLDPAEDAERLVLGRVTPDTDRVRVQVNSQRRLTKLLRILADIGAEPGVAGQAQSEPSLDFAWGRVPDGASSAREWEKAWLEQSVAVLDFRSPRHAAASAAEGSTAEALRLESLLRQLEYQAGLAAARGERPIDAEWLRAELGLTAPLGERLP